MTRAEIKDYLENYQYRKTVASYKEKLGETNDRTVVCIRAIEDCMSSLPNGLDEVLKMIYINNRSMRDISKDLYYSRETLRRKRNEALNILADCLCAV